MTVIAHKKEDTENYRFFMGRKISRCIAHALAVFVYCAASTAAAVDSQTWHYGLDNAGNITSRGVDPAPENATHTYIYDGLYRLTDETNPNNTDQYDYDPNGNRTGFTRDGNSTTYQIDSNSNRLDQVGSDPRTYDNIGNTKTDRNGTRVFTYNKAGRLSQVHENSVLLATYTYNALGQRAIKTTASGTTYYMYDTSGQLLGEYDDDGQPIKEYVHLSGEPVAQLENSKITYLHTDHLATARMATDEAGKVVWKWDGEAFGNKAPVTNNGTTINLRFPGQQYDEETGLYYNYFRYYDPATGRYITSDPIGLWGSINTYGYVYGNPLVYFDLDGGKGARPGRNNSGNPRPRGRNNSGTKGSWSYGKFYPSWGTLRPTHSEPTPNSPIRPRPEHNPNTWREQWERIPGEGGTREDKTGPHDPLPGWRDENQPLPDPPPGSLPGTDCYTKCEYVNEGPNECYVEPRLKCRLVCP